ncbi:MAG: hypothetical protein ABIL76_08515 [candidate division WOR-3 bacterium]
MAKERKGGYIQAMSKPEKGIDVFVDKYETALDKVLDLTLKIIDELNDEELSTNQKMRFLEMVLPTIKSYTNRDSLVSKYAILYKQLSDKQPEKEKEALIIMKAQVSNEN